MPALPHDGASAPASSFGKIIAQKRPRRALSPVRLQFVDDGRSGSAGACGNEAEICTSPRQRRALGKRADAQVGARKAHEAEMETKFSKTAVAREYGAPVVERSLRGARFDLKTAGARESGAPRHSSTAAPRTRPQPGSGESIAPRASCARRAPRAPLLRRPATRRRPRCRARWSRNGLGRTGRRRRNSRRARTT